MSATLDALIAENRKLRRDLMLYEARLRAVERSRWWRAHPRRLLPRGAARVDWHPPADREPAGEREAAVAIATPEVVDDPVLAAFRAEVVARGSFSQDWVTTRFARWHPLLEELEDRPSRILEIGSYEGMSACYLLWRLPGASLTCIDTFTGTPEDAGTKTPRLEHAFDANVALVDPSRVRKLGGDSKRRLLDLVDAAEQFDLVYVDGSHLGLDVLVDAALAWQLLTPSGLIVFDDYRWLELGQDPLLRPGKAIDAFCELIAEKHEVLFTGEQVALRRVSERVGDP